jgi:hypothetical protein
MRRGGEGLRLVGAQPCRDRQGASLLHHAAVRPENALVEIRIGGKAFISISCARLSSQLIPGRSARPS